jgi:hypothetical protein
MGYHRGLPWVGAQNTTSTHKTLRASEFSVRVREFLAGRAFGAHTSDTHTLSLTHTHNHSYSHSHSHSHTPADVEHGGHAQAHAERPHVGYPVAHHVRDVLEQRNDDGAQAHEGGAEQQRLCPRQRQAQHGAAHVQVEAQLHRHGAHQEDARGGHERVPLPPQKRQVRRVHHPQRQAAVNTNGPTSKRQQAKDGRVVADRAGFESIVVCSESLTITCFLDLGLASGTDGNVWLTRWSYVPSWLPTLAMGNLRWSVHCCRVRFESSGEG